KKLDAFIIEREKWAQYYNGQFCEIDWLRIPLYDAKYNHGWQSYVLSIDETKAPMNRNELMEYLQQQGISTRPGTHAVHMLGYYAKTYNLKPSAYPSAFAANEYSMAIPLHNKMTEEDYHYIAN